MKPFLLAVLPHPSACSPCPDGKLLKYLEIQPEWGRGEGEPPRTWRKWGGADFSQRLPWADLCLHLLWRDLFYQQLANSLWDVGREDEQASDGWLNGHKQTYNMSSHLFSLFSSIFFIETCMPLHLLLPSLLTADVEVLFRTQGLYLVFQSNNFNVWVDTIDEEPWVLLHSIMYDSLLSKYVITALSYNNYVIFLDRSNWNLLCREVITAYFSSFVSEWVAFMGKKIMHAQNSL